MSERSLLKELKAKLEETRNSCIDKAQSLPQLSGRIPFEIRSTTLSLIIKYIDEILNDKGDKAMIKLDQALAVQVVRLEDIPQRTRHSVWADKIKELANKLEKGQAAQIDASLVSYVHFAGNVGKLKRQGVLPKNIEVRKAGKDFYLAKA